MHIIQSRFLLLAIQKYILTNTCWYKRSKKNKQKKLVYNITKLT